MVDSNFEIANKTGRDYFDKRRSQLINERSSFIAHFKDLSRFIQPRRGRFDTNDRNKGDRRYNAIINSKATQAHRSSRAGLFAGVMSPARPWFKLETPNRDLMKRPGVKLWLARVEEIIRSIHNASNLYAMAPVVLGETLLFATGAMSHVNDFNDVARFYTHTAGSYMIGQNDRLEVNTLVRDFQMTSEQMVGEFGLSNVPLRVKRDYDNGAYHNWNPIVHFVEPNPNHDPTSKQSADKRMRSVKYATGDGESKNKFLSRKGFDSFPAYVLRWDVTGEDVYGTDCPAMTALGDIRGLQTKEKHKAQGIAKQVNPPLHGPATLRNIAISALPGGITIYDSEGTSGLKPVYEVKPDISGMIADIDKSERIIDEAFYVDLFLAISRMEGIQPKNQFELSQRNAERLLQLGPVLERIHGELLDKLIDRTFAQAVAAGIIPPAPLELQGSPLEVRYISSLAQAQKAVASGGIERVFAFAQGIASVVPSIMDKLNADEAIEEYAGIIGVPPRLIRDEDEVGQIRQARAKELAKAQALQSAAGIAAAAKDGAGAVKSLTEANNA